MSYAELILPEFEHEMANTRKVLERIPNDKLDWKPHSKSNTIGWVANHLAEIVGWVEGTFASPEWDIAPEGEEPYESPALGSREEILALFDQGVANARRTIEAATDESVQEMWSLKEKGNTLMSMPRGVCVRGFILNHTVHHRAILCVYLRLNDIPVPGMYGQSGDE